MKPLKFSLKMAVEDMPEGEELKSQTEVHFDVSWFLRVNREEDNLGVYLHCSKEEDAENSWFIRGTSEIRLASAMRRIKHKESCSFFYSNWKDQEYEEAGCMSWQDASEGIIPDGSAMIYCDVTINEMMGTAPKRKRSFEEPEEHLTDVVLKIRKEKFHVSKATLAAQSLYFKRLFFENVNEAKESEIELKDVDDEWIYVDPDVFQIILEIIYGDFDIPAENVKSLLELGHKLDVPLVMKRCEKFLLETDEIENKEKLRFADTFTLKNLMKDCLDKMTTSNELKSFMPADLTVLSQPTLAAILEKNLLQC